MAGGGFNSTSQTYEGHLASRQAGHLNFPGNTEQPEKFIHPDLHLVETEQKHGYLYPATPIIEALEEYLENPAVTLHIPGHGHGDGVLPRFKTLLGNRAIKADTTDDFDGLGQLYPPSGPIKEAQELAAKTFDAAHTFFLVNGSTVGNLALAMAVTRPGKKVLMARNCHRSVISGITTTGAVPVWVIPERNDEWGIWGAINPATVRAKLEQNPDISVVWITNPTYEGVISDIAAIAAVCKEFDVPLIVDEAHGCHWNFNDKLPTSSIHLGADAVIHSIHKTGGSFSQSSMLHLAHGSKFKYEDILGSLMMLQSTSPSYILLASLDAARAFLASTHGRMRLEETIQVASSVRDRLNELDGCRCLTPSEDINIDPTKMYVSIDGLSGKQLKHILEMEFNIEVEAKTDKGVLALANIGNTESELEYFYEALRNITSRRHFYGAEKGNMRFMPFSIPEMVLIPRDAHFCDKEQVRPIDAIGRVSAEIIAVCPPGIPIVVPGEKIQLEHMHYLRHKDLIWVTR
jgi:arginine/lysine/ornithine decarboxylase